MARGGDFFRLEHGVAGGALQRLFALLGAGGLLRFAPSALVMARGGNFFLLDFRAASGALFYLFALFSAGSLLRFGPFRLLMLAGSGRALNGHRAAGHSGGHIVVVRILAEIDPCAYRVIAGGSALLNFEGERADFAGRRAHARQAAVIRGNHKAVGSGSAGAFQHGLVIADDNIRNHGRAVGRERDVHRHRVAGLPRGGHRRAGAQGQHQQRANQNQELLHTVTSYTFV